MTKSEIAEKLDAFFVNHLAQMNFMNFRETNCRSVEQQAGIETFGSPRTSLSKERGFRYHLRGGEVVG